MVFILFLMKTSKQKPQFIYRCPDVGVRVGKRRKPVALRNVGGKLSLLAHLQHWQLLVVVVQKLNLKFLYRMNLNILLNCYVK